MIRRPPRSTPKPSSAASDVYKRQPENCIYLGELKYREMPSFYHSVSVTLIPSLTECFPNTLLESYASGRPVLISKKAMPQICKLYGFSLNHEAEEWRKVLHHLRENQDLLSRLGLEASKYASQYSWDEYGRRLSNHLRRVIGED